MNVAKRKPVVIDTNVIVSGLLCSNTYPAKIVEAWILGKIQVVLSKELKQELHQVFKKPYISKMIQNQRSIKPILGGLFNKSLTFVPEAINKVIFPDKKDHFLLELAVTSKAVAIVTGDKQLLDVKRVKGIQIINPKNFCINCRL